MSETISILGATGSIGDSTLNVIKQYPEHYKLGAITAKSNVHKLIMICRQYSPSFASIYDASLLPILREAVKDLPIETATGMSGLIHAAQFPAHRIMAGIVGFSGLLPTLEALKQGTILMLANKECLVSAGALFIEEAEKYNCKILPVDSEHNALYQLLENQNISEVHKLVLTASGGAFLHYTDDELENITPEMAIKHPTWSMGAKISVDSATLMNKGLELIEAQHLFSMAYEKLDILIHPQSIVHGLIHMSDGSILTQMGIPDMRIPISYCMGWPNRLPMPHVDLNLSDIATLDFLTADMKTFPCLDIAWHVMKEGKSLPIILNASNEIAVEAFLNRQISFKQISHVISSILEDSSNAMYHSIEDVYEIDHLARQKTLEKLTKFK